MLRVLCIFSVLTVGLGCSAPKEVPTVTELAGPLANKVFDLYHAHHATGSTVDHFWLTGNEDLLVAATRTEDWRQGLLPLVEEAGKVSPLAVKTANLFREANLTVYDQGSSRASFSLFEVDEKAALAKMTSGQLELCFVPKSEVGGAHLPSGALYREDWPGVLLTADSKASAFTAAVIMHEIGHSVMHREDKDRVHMDMLSPANVREEVLMHELESLVLDHLTAGKWQALIDEVASRTGGKEGKAALANVYASIKEVDLLRMDEICGITDGAPETAGQAAAQFLLVVTFEVVEQYNPEAEWLDKKMAAYKYLKTAMVR